MSAPAAPLAAARPARRPALPPAVARLLRDRAATAGALVFVTIALVALLAPVLPLQPPDASHLAVRLRPVLTPGHLLGTDQLGRDILSRLVWGTRLSLAVGLFAALASSLVGSAIGLAAAYRGGLVDAALMRGIDALMAFPYLLLALAIVAALGPGLFDATIAIVVVNVPFFARGVRGAALPVVRADFMAAARLCGLSDLRIILTELLPNVVPGIVVGVSLAVGWMVLETAGLSFLGLGAQPPEADLGGMLGEGRSLLEVAPHVAAIPGLVILLLAVAVNLVGDGLRDALDPRLKAGGVARSRARTDAAPASERRRGLGDPLALARLPLALRGLRAEFRVGRSVFAAVGGVDIAVAPGEAVGIVGESGSGKTVTALSVLGLVASPPGRITGGEVLHHGEDLAAVALRRLQDVRGGRIACVFQDPGTSLNPLIPVGEQIAEVLRRHGGLGRAAARARAVELLGAVLIPEPAETARRYPHEMSGGQRQRVGIAMALADDPELIIADEPTTALDVTTQAKVLALLDDLRRERGSALLFISHDFGVVAALCDRVHVMYAGRVVESGPVAAVLAGPRHPYTRRLLACVPELGGGRRRVAPIPGLPPSTDALPRGCAFAPRCDMALPACAEGEIALRPVGPGRSARCIRADEA